MSDVTDFDFDTSISDVANLISFADPADGTHIYRVVFTGKDLSRGENPVMGFSFVYQKVATIELADADAIDAPIGSIFNENFTGHEKAKAIFKLRVSQIFGRDAVDEAAKAGHNLGYFLEPLSQLVRDGLYLQIVTKIVKTTSKKDKKVTYDNVRIQDLQAVDASEVPLPDGFEVYEYEPNLPED